MVVRIGRPAGSPAPEASSLSVADPTLAGTDAMMNGTGLHRACVTVGLTRPARERGGAPQYAASVRIASAIFDGESMNASSSGREFGEAGDSGPARRVTGPSR
jgi:hypothetical protein